MRSFLTEACFQPLRKINTLIHVLLDAGADANDGMGPGGGALLAALLGGQGKDVIVKIVRKAAFVGESVLSIAVQKERVDVLGELLRKRWERIDIERLLLKAREEGNGRVVEILEEFRSRTEERSDEDEFGKIGEQRKRWKFGSIR